MPAVPTVSVKFRKGKGWGRINENDFDPELHERLEGEVETPTPPPAPPSGNEGGGTAPAEDLSKLTRAPLIERLEAAGGKLADVEGTGKNGVVKNEDLVKAIQSAEAKKAGGGDAE